MMINNSVKKLGVYVHIPFCVSKCPYCGFYSRGIESLSQDELRKDIDGYLDRIAGEVRSYSELRDDYLVDSIFIGGGTPSLMWGKEVKTLMNIINEGFQVPVDCEVTMEGNPGTLSPEKLDGYLDAGINRLSVGVQSFDDGVLKTLGRIHVSAEAEKSFRLAREAGFRNINLDLMFGVPGMDDYKWQDTLEKAISLDPEHISFYSLQIEEGTPYYKSFMAGDFDEVPEDEDREMYHTAIRTLKGAGYKHYEISNAAKPGFECRHNLKYWTGQEYIGIGDSAASYLIGDDGRGLRYSTMKGERIDEHQNSEFDDMSEYMFTGLRLECGVSYSGFRSRFGLDMEEAFKERWGELKDFFRGGYLEKRVDAEGHSLYLRLTEKGIDISNRIMAIFV